ncbi:leucyl aminopeptidase [Actinoalloteichus hoggarensis]|uniref:Probable cytosol aminopeptidase n=1 Tax=Actinoalloteichus hoggarensis TaxID=1470176 RepID=A0A221VYB9_9PSEU|nr:M17 family metallopeptidase [Actinoalloteichus hoggarensis]ASO18536.1 Cytosol aminopeptidase [Actinoalloteichus hoggarensis]MBB5921904.1 leucyl aminopeptidase [Actinoalloteichus hoggarensis]
MSLDTLPDVPVSPPRLRVLAGAPAPASIHAWPVFSAETPRHTGETQADAPLPALGADQLTEDCARLRSVGFRGKAGSLERIGLDAAPPRWLFGAATGSPADWRAAGAAVLRAAEEHDRQAHEAGLDTVDEVSLLLPATLDEDEITALAIGVSLGAHRFTVTGRERPPRPTDVTFVLPAQTPEDTVAATASVVDRAAALSSATALARDLANAPSNVKNPEWLARTAVAAGAAYPDLTVAVRDEQWLTDHGFGGVLAVGGGSASPPRLIELSWRPEVPVHGPHLVLVGKGITFDTGGVSLKPADGMHLMRTDMAGGAAVIAALIGIAALRLPVRVTGLVPSAENHVSGSAYRPGDVVTHFGGRTSEIVNTDAEGRLVLADGLAYAVERLDPTILVDVATLTGAMKISLGLRTGGLFSSDDALADAVTAAGDKVGESWWRMPLLADHAEDVRGDWADVRQGPPGPGGVMAALFLREFTAGLPWVHLDIAGPARADRSYAEVNPGATGFAARTLIELVAGRIPS